MASSHVQPACSYEQCTKGSFTACNSCGKSYCSDHIRLTRPGPYCSICLGEEADSRELREDVYKLGAITLLIGSLLVLLSLFVLPFISTDTVGGLNGVVYRHTSQTGVEAAFSPLGTGLEWSPFYFFGIWVITVLPLRTGVRGLVRKLPKKIPLLYFVPALSFTLIWWIKFLSDGLGSFSPICSLTCYDSPDHYVQHSYFDVGAVCLLIGFLALPILGGILMAAASRIGEQSRASSTIANDQ